MAKDYTADDYRRMLINVLDIHYGGAVHHIGDGDGLNETEAAEIREFWQSQLDAVVEAYVKLRSSRNDPQPRT